MIRPSSLPILKQCPRFRSSGSEPGDDRDSGTKRHKAMERLLASNDPLLLTELPQGEAEAVEWAVEQIRLKAPMADYPLVIEQRRKWFRPDFTEVSGTPDVICGPVLFDLKTRERDYAAQMADYALSILQSGHKRVKVYLLFTATKRIQEMEFDLDTASAAVQAVLDLVTPDAQPTPCDYCGWCAEAFKCPVHLAAAETVSKGYTQDPRVQAWRPSEMKTGEELAYALWIWRTQLKKWGESVEFHAKEAALKSGQTLTCKVAEFALKPRKGKSYVPDVAAAFSLCGLPQEEFLKCCDLRIETSKKYPDKRGVANAYAGLHGMKLAPAKRELLTKLGDVVKQTPETISLVATKAGAEEESE